MRPRELARICDRILETKKFRDYPGAKNGLQVGHGRAVKKIGWAVDADVASIRRAGKQKVDFLVVHHGIFWGDSALDRKIRARRIREAKRLGVAVYSSHLPLDAHPEIGNSTGLLRAFGLANAKRRPFGKAMGREIGWKVEGGTLTRSVLINGVGWALLIPVLAMVYVWCQHRGYRLAPMRASPEELDRRLLPFLRVVSLGLIVLILLPMAVTRAVPLVGGGQGTDVRYEMLSSGTARPLYHFATGLVPVVSAALLVSILRRWRSFPFHDLALLLGMAALQVLSGNRLPLAIAMFIGATLLTLEFRLPRWIFPPLYVGFLGLFMFLGGFSSLMRTERDRLKEGDPFLASLSEVYMGNNVIDLRDGAWVMGHWDFQPLLGQTYLGGLTAMAPSALFPKKHDWHLGLTAVRMVGMDPATHFGLRITFFGEAFLNFGWAGVLRKATPIS